MRKIFALVLAVLMFGLVACGGESAQEEEDCSYESEFRNSKSVAGEIAEMRTTSKGDSLFRVVDNDGISYRFGMYGTHDLLDEGVRVKVEYESMEYVYRICDGQKELVETYEDWPHNFTKTSEPQRNSDGTTTFVTVTWKKAKLNDITLLPK